MRSGLADQQRELFGKPIPSIDQAQDGLGKILSMDERLRGAQHARVEMGGQPMLIDACDLLGEKGGAAIVFVDAGDP